MLYSLNNVNIFLCYFCSKTRVKDNYGLGAFFPPKKGFTVSGYQLYVYV